MPELESKAVEAIRADPERGVVVPGSGGYRKIRIAIEGRGKRGGARVLYLLVHIKNTAYLAAVLSKNQAEDFSSDFIAELKRAAPEIERYVVD